jgi:hypothetical protein
VLSAVTIDQIVHATSLRACGDRPTLFVNLVKILAASEFVVASVAGLSLIAGENSDEARKP